MLRKIGLFFLSLWLLFLLLIIITADIPMCFSKNSEFVGFGYLISHNIIPLFCIISLIIGAFSYYDFIFTTKGSPNLSFEIMEIENIDYEHLTFLTTYIFPLITFNFVSIRYQIVFFILLLVIGIIYIRTDLFYANPTLAILRFRIYRDWNGDLLLDADFQYVNCNSFRLTKSNWFEHIAFFEEALEICEKSNAGKCHLIPITVYYKEKL